MIRWIAAAALCALSISAEAQIQPAPGPGDPRIQVVRYDANQVVQLQAAPGYQVTVELAPDERIENVAIGDSAAWSVTPNKRGDRLFIKSTQNGRSTNLTVVTDARSYAFELQPLYGPLPNMAFIIRFEYPSLATATVVATPKQGGRYRVAGARAIRPAAVSDDGDKTYIEWMPDQSMPAVFSLDGKGKEILVDGMVRDGRYVVDSVHAHLVFRLDKQVATATRLRMKKPDS
jgi:type IV secretion system protein VirB9